MAISQTTQNWYHHNFDPFALTIGDVNLPWYWLNYIIGWFWCDFAGKKWIQSLPDTQNHAIYLSAFRSFMLLAWLLMLAGARLGYVTLYNYSYFKAHPDQLVAIWNGGMSFHGGLAGVALAALLVARRYKMSTFTMTDPIAFAVAPIIFLGRITNFINGELPGRPSQLPWAIIFPPPYDDGPRHPSQLYEALGEGLLVGLALFYLRHALRLRTGAMSIAFVLFYSSARFIIEFFRQPDPQVGMISGLSLGQWLSLGLIMASIVSLWRLKPQRPNTAAKDT